MLQEQGEAQQPHKQVVQAKRVLEGPDTAEEDLETVVDELMDSIRTVLLETYEIDKIEHQDQVSWRAVIGDLSEQPSYIKRPTAQQFTLDQGTSPYTDKDRLAAIGVVYDGKDGEHPERFATFYTSHPDTEHIEASVQHGSFAAALQHLGFPAAAEVAPVETPKIVTY